MEQEAYRLNPDFWIEMSVWDGFTGGTHIPAEKNNKRKHYESLGQSFSPERYAGFVQFGMWLLRPRAVREFRNWIHPWEDGKLYFMAIVDSVDRVYHNARLRDWWHKGELVPNRAIGEYIAKIYEESKARPTHIVSSRCGFGEDGKP